MKLRTVSHFSNEDTKALLVKSLGRRLRTTSPQRPAVMPHILGFIRLRWLRNVDRP